MGKNHNHRNKGFNHYTNPDPRIKAKEDKEDLQLTQRLIGLDEDLKCRKALQAECDAMLAKIKQPNVGPTLEGTTAPKGIIIIGGNDNEDFKHYYMAAQLAKHGYYGVFREVDPHADKFNVLPSNEGMNAALIRQAEEDERQWNEYFKSLYHGHKEEGIDKLTIERLKTVIEEVFGNKFTGEGLKATVEDNVNIIEPQAGTGKSKLFADKVKLAAYLGINVQNPKVFHYEDPHAKPLEPIFGHAEPVLIHKGIAIRIKHLDRKAIEEVIRIIDLLKPETDGQA